LWPEETLRRDHHIGNKPVAGFASPRFSATCFVSKLICSSGLQARGFSWQRAQILTPEGLSYTRNEGETHATRKTRHKTPGSA
jgi:hypothetical protein